MADPLPRAHRYWFVLALSMTLLLVAVRNVAFLLPHDGDSYQWPLAVAVILEAVFEIFQVPVVMPVSLALGALVAVLLLFRRRWCLRRTGARWSAASWLHSLVWLVLFCNNFSLDVSPRLALIAFASLGALWPAAWSRVEALSPAPPGPTRMALWGAALAATPFLADDPAEAAAILVWGVVLVLLVEVGGRFLALRDRVALAFLALCAVQLVQPILPVFVRLHDGVKFSEGPAYTFCESPAHGKLYASIQTCTFGSKDCLDSYVAEHDIHDYLQWRPLRFFDKTFVGRLQHLVCLEDTVQIGMNETRIHGRTFHENVMEFDMADPSRFTKNVLGDGAGFRLAYDRVHQAIYYVSEWTPRVYRYDRKTGTLDKDVGTLWNGRLHFDSYVVGNYSIDEGRDRMYVGSKSGRIAEINLKTQEVVRGRVVVDGLFLFHAVDPELRRLWVTGTWGLTVIDLDGFTTLKRKRLGRFNRTPVIDAKHDIVYMASTYEGKLRAFDRRSLEYLGAIPLGSGVRVPFVSGVTGRVVVSSSAGCFYWDGEALARRFRSRTSWAGSVFQSRAAPRSPSTTTAARSDELE